MHLLVVLSQKNETDFGLSYFFIGGDLNRAPLAAREGARRARPVGDTASRVSEQTGSYASDKGA